MSYDEELKKAVKQAQDSVNTLIAMVKGDVPGHEFHGNQWTAGGGGGGGVAAGGAAASSDGGYAPPRGAKWSNQAITSDNASKIISEQVDMTPEESDMVNGSTNIHYYQDQSYSAESQLEVIQGVNPSMKIAWKYEDFEFKTKPIK